MIQCIVFFIALITGNCNSALNKIDQINNDILSEQYQKIDTVYIEESNLIIIENNQKYVIKEIIKDAAALSTSLKYDKLKEEIYLTYDYRSSFMKRKINLKLKWKNRKLNLKKIYHILYDSREESGYEFGWVILFGSDKHTYINKYDDVVALESIIDYNNDKSEILVSSRKERLILEKAPNNSSSKWPAFYSDGTLIGHYAKDHSSTDLIFLESALSDKLKFASDLNISKNITHFNDIGYFLEQVNENKEASAVLERVINANPNRTVAYINLGDAYWGLNMKLQAKQAYLTYIEQMKASGNEVKIPARVNDRVQKLKY